MLTNAIRLAALALGLMSMSSMSMASQTKGEGLKPVEGLWQGTLKVGALELRLALHVDRAAGKEGEHKATFDSLDQNATGLAIDAITLEKRTLKFSMKRLQASYEGTLSESGREIKGKFTQAGQSFPLDFRKTEAIEAPKRTQMPKPPFPYRTEEATFVNSKGGHALAGTLTIPKGKGPFAAAILISGSGPQDRDESLLSHKPFLVLADDLTKRGIAVLRYDDRGVGGSKGDFASATTVEFSEDAEAAIDYLKTRKEIDGSRIGLVGHSEGGLIAPMVAARRSDLAFIVLMAGPGVDGARIIEVQSRLVAEAERSGEAKASAWEERLTRRIIGVVKANAESKDIESVIRKEIEAIETELTGSDKEAFLQAKDALRAGVKPLLTPWFRFFLTYDPKPALAKTRCPVLAINGERDLQVEPKENLGEIAKALKSGGNSRVVIQELPGLNHLFQPSKTGAVSEYGKIEVTIAPAALKTIGEWVVKTTAKR